MREILFRGKRIDNVDFVEGYLIEQNNPEYHAYIIKQFKAEMDNLHMDILECYMEEVDQSTVGQFTGLTDKNGKKIFEGDVVHVLGNQQVEDWKNVDYIGSIAFLDAGFCVIDGTIEDHAFRRYQLPRLDFGLKVIGNIYDNPELLEVE